MSSIDQNYIVQLTNSAKIRELNLGYSNLDVTVFNTIGICTYIPTAF